MENIIVPSTNVKQPVNSRYYYDLDGTISTLNSTFDFINGYLRYKKKFLRLYLGKVIAVFLIRTGNYHPYNSRRLLIDIYFKGLHIDDLEKYFIKIYKPFFLESLTPLGVKLLQNKETADVMLTGCTEIPAKLIGDIFGFKEVISTEFLFEKGKITGIKNDTYGCLKEEFITKSDLRMIYYTDDLKSEESLIKLMDEIIEV